MSCLGFLIILIGFSLGCNWVIILLGMFITYVGQCQKMDKKGYK